MRVSGRASHVHRKLQIRHVLRLELSFPWRLQMPSHRGLCSCVRSQERHYQLDGRQESDRFERFMSQDQLWYVLGRCRLYGERTHDQQDVPRVVHEESREVFQYLWLRRWRHTRLCLSRRTTVRRSWLRLNAMRAQSVVQLLRCEQQSFLCCWRTNQESLLHLVIIFFWLIFIFYEQQTMIFLSSLSTCTDGTWKCDTKDCKESIKCPKNQIFSSNASACPKSCGNKKHYKDCGQLIEDCTCPEGTIFGYDVIYLFYIYFLNVRLTTHFKTCLLMRFDFFFKFVYYLDL